MKFLKYNPVLLITILITIFDISLFFFNLPFIMSKKIYLDYASTTPLFPEVKKSICKIMNDYFANPSSLHSLGLECELMIQNSRRNITEILGCKNHNLYFTSGATESNNWAIESALKLRRKNGKTIVACKTAHPSISEKVKSVEKNGVNVLFLPVDNNGRIEIEVLKTILPPDTFFISILLVNNETGVIQPINEITPIIKKIAPQCIIHIDAVQAFGKIENNFISDYIDLISISAHKIGGPKGIGALLVKKNLHIPPLIYGGGQESNLRGGTENITGIYGFSTSSEIINKKRQLHFKKMSLLQQTFEDYIKSNIKDILINGEKTKRSPYISNISFKNVPGEVLVHALEKEDIFISTGSACSSRKNVFSHVLKAMNVENSFLEGGVRISFFTETEIEDVLFAAKSLEKAVSRIRKIKNPT